MVKVVNAHIYRGCKLAHEFGGEDLDVCFDVNVTGTSCGYRTAIKLFLKHIIDRYLRMVLQLSGGPMLNISSPRSCFKGGNCPPDVLPRYQ